MSPLDLDLRARPAPIGGVGFSSRMIWYACVTDGPPPDPDHAPPPLSVAARELLDRPSAEVRGTLWGEVERVRSERRRDQRPIALPLLALTIALIAGATYWMWREPSRAALASELVAAVLCVWAVFIPLSLMQALPGIREARFMPQRLFFDLGATPCDSEPLRNAIADMRAASGIEACVFVDAYSLPFESLNACLVEKENGGALLVAVTDGLLEQASQAQLTAVVANLFATYLAGSPVGWLCDADALMLTKDPGPMLEVLELVLGEEHRVRDHVLAPYAGTAAAPRHDEVEDEYRLVLFRRLVHGAEEAS